jgi:hypothetical protein
LNKRQGSKLLISDFDALISGTSNAFYDQCLRVFAGSLTFGSRKNLKKERVKKLHILKGQLELVSFDI